MVTLQFMIYSWVSKQTIPKCTREYLIGKEIIPLFKVNYTKKENWSLVIFFLSEIILQSSNYSSDINDIIYRITLFHCNEERCLHTGFEG